jgi:hypothetical protein
VSVSRLDRLYRLYYRADHHCEVTVLVEALHRIPQSADLEGSSNPHQLLSEPVITCSLALRALASAAVDFDAFICIFLLETTTKAATSNREGPSPLT